MFVQGPGARHLPLGVCLRKGTDVELVRARLVRRIGDPSSVRGKHRKRVARGRREEAERRASRIHRKNPDVRRLVSLLFLVREVLPIRRDRHGHLYGAVRRHRQLFGLAGSVRANAVDAVRKIRIHDEPSVVGPHGSPLGRRAACQSDRQIALQVVHEQVGRVGIHRNPRRIGETLAVRREAKVAIRARFADQEARVAGDATPFDHVETLPARALSRQSTPDVRPRWRIEPIRLFAPDCTLGMTTRGSPRGLSVSASNATTKSASPRRNSRSPLARNAGCAASSITIFSLPDARSTAAMDRPCTAELLVRDLVKDDLTPGKPYRRAARSRIARWQLRDRGGTVAGRGYALQRRTDTGKHDGVILAPGGATRATVDRRQRLRRHRLRS